MKPLKEALITKDKRDWASAKEKWPNPYGLTEKDQTGWLKNFPLEIITLMIKEAKDLRDKDFDIKKLKVIYNLMGVFTWDDTKDGHEFWKSIKNGNYKVFYDKYTPELLRKRLEE